MFSTEREAVVVLASGSKINWDKTAALLLGVWTWRPPDPGELDLGSDIEVLKAQERFRLLGIQTGFKVDPHVSVTKAIGKMRAYLAARPQRSLTINGSILIIKLTNIIIIK